MHELAEKKLARLERLLPRVDDAVIEVSYQETRAMADRYGVQVTVRSGPAILRAEERAGDPQAALEVATDVLARQARRHKKRLHDRYRSGGTKEWAPPDEPAIEEPPVEGDDEEIEYVLGNVVRVKHFEVKPMSEEEALLQMDLIGHDFFIFLDARTNEYALLYRRKDGDYGLLTPERSR
jgi:putative sigma-54 modulation protein